METQTTQTKQVAQATQATQATRRGAGALGGIARRIAHVAVAAFVVAAQSAAAEPSPKGHAIAAAHPLAVAAGEVAFAAGGNAFDAAVAVSAALAVVEPYSSGLGGGGFWLLHIASHKASHGRDAHKRDVFVDGREVAPDNAHKDMYLDENGDVIAGKSINGAAAAGIPGSPAALVHIARSYGNLPLTKTLAPAIRYAKEGFAVDETYVAMARRRLETLQASPDAQRIFLDRGRVPQAGWRLKQPDLANTLTAIAQHGHAGFYSGAVAKAMTDAVRAAGGYWSGDDLARYKIKERAPITFNYRGARIVSAPPPSSGGVALASMLTMLSLLPEPATELERVHTLVEVMRRAYRDRALWLGDSDFVDVPVKRLTGVAHARKLISDFDARRATPSGQHSEPKTRGRDTTHFSIIDADGNRVAATMSVNYGFGCGFVAGASGVLLNNEMDDFAIKPNTPNIYGLIGGTANAIAPGKRMLSSMSPTFVDDGERIAIIGTPGGSRIITMVLLGILKFMDGARAHEIVATPRLHHQYIPDRIQFEDSALDPAVRTMLEARGHTLEPVNEYFGNMHAVVWDYKRNTLDAAADPRGIGTATTVHPSAAR